MLPSLCLEYGRSLFEPDVTLFAEYVVKFCLGCRLKREQIVAGLN